MNSRLLSCTDADCLSLVCIAYRVRLSVLKSDKSYNKVTHCLLGKRLILGYDILEERRLNLKVVSSLLKGNSVYLLGLLLCGNVLGVDFNYIVITLLLRLEYLERLVGIAGSYNTVGNLTLDKECRSLVAHVGEGNPIAEGGHSVGSARSRVCAGKGRVVKTLDVIYEAGSLKLVGELNANRRRGGAYVLEGGRRCKTGSLLKLLNELPGVKCIKKVYVSGSARENLYRKLGAVCHINLRRLLVGVTAVLEFKFFHSSSLSQLFLLISLISCFAVVRSV